MMFIRQNTFKNLPKVLILTLMILSNCFAMELGSKEILGSKQEDKLERCVICYEDFPTKDLLGLHCGHKFCKKCLVEFVRSQTNAGVIPPRCPCCRKDFTDEDVDNVLEEHIFEVWDFLKNLHVMNKEEDFFSCRTPNCRNGLLYSKEDENDGEIWKCDKCLYQYCLKCKREAHTGSCDDYQKYLEDNLLTRLSVRQLFNIGEIKRCPKCRIFTHRVNNNRDIMCERCGTSWCWHCIKLRGLCQCLLRKRKRSKEDSAKGKYRKKRKLNEDEDEDEDEGED